MVLNIVIQNSNKAKLEGSQPLIYQLREELFCKHPNAWHLRNVMPRGWDGKIRFITEAGYIKMGMVPRLIQTAEAMFPEAEVYIHDHRKGLLKPTIPQGLNGKTFRPYQRQAIKAVVKNKVGGIPFPMGVINAATNAGKTWVMAGIHESYQRNYRSIVLLNDADLFDQFKKEMPELLPDEDIKFVRGKEKDFGNFTVAMVPTLARNIKDHYLRQELGKFDIVMVDEADLSNNKSYKDVLQNLWNAQVRTGLSGSIYLSKLKKDALQNENYRQLFGDEVFKISKRELVDLGHSTELIIKIIKGNTNTSNKYKGDFREEYNQYITENTDRHEVCLQRAIFNAERGRVPMIVVCQFHAHVYNLYNHFKKRLGDSYRITYAHHEVKNRKQIFEDYKEGKIDILIVSFIIKRGKNLPLIKYIQNAAGSDSQETIMQIMGRGERKHDDKTKTYIDDIYDEGFYLKRHSKHRINYYKKERFKVINKTK